MHAYDSVAEQVSLKRADALQELHDGIKSIRDEIKDLVILARRADMPEVKWTLCDLRKTLDSCNEDVADDLEAEVCEAAQQKEAKQAEENRAYEASQ